MRLPDQHGHGRSRAGNASMAMNENNALTLFRLGMKPLAKLQDGRNIFFPRKPHALFRFNRLVEAQLKLVALVKGAEYLRFWIIRIKDRKNMRQPAAAVHCQFIEAADNA